MITKYLKRSVASAAAVGAVLAAAAVTTPSVVTSAPEIERVACFDGYAGQVTTRTDLRVSSTGPYGAQPVASVTVASQGDPHTPAGDVRLVIEGVDSWRLDLSRGAASKRLPVLDARETYTVKAVYIPACDEFQRSSETAYRTVLKASTAVSASAPDRERGERPVVRGAVTSDHIAPGGRVRVTISNGARERVETVPVDRADDGRSTYRAVFDEVSRLGRWDASVVYLGTGNFERSSDRTSLSVTRR